MKRRLPPETVAKVIKMNEKGFMQWEIAATLGISAMSVSRFLRQHNVRVYDILARDHAAERGRQARHLTAMFREAMNEWERSKTEQGKVRFTEENTDGTDGKPKKTTRTEKEVRDNLGNPAYLDRAQSILAAIREIMMMSKDDKPEEIEPVAGEHDVTKALERLNEMARNLKRETSKAIKEHGSDLNELSQSEQQYDIDDDD